VLIQKSKEDLIQKKDSLARRLLELENNLLETRFKKYISQLDGFILTKYAQRISRTLPALLWRPTEPSDVLTKLARESAEQLKVPQLEIVGQGVGRVQARQVCVGAHPVLQGSCVELDGIPDQCLRPLLSPPDR